jgi:hypothetical protein
MQLIPLVQNLEPMTNCYWTAYDRQQFAARHLLETADSTQLRNHNLFWPAGTTLAQVEEYLYQVLANTKFTLPPAGKLGHGLGVYEVPLNNGIKLRLGINSNGRVVLAQPLTGPYVIRVTLAEARLLFNHLHRSQ